MLSQHACWSLQTQPVWTNTAGRTPASVPLPARFVSSASQRKGRSSATRPASTRKAVPTAATSATKPSKVHALLTSLLLSPRDFDSAHVVFVSSQGAAPCSPASTQRHEEVPVFGLRLQVHPTGEDPLCIVKPGRVIAGQS